MWQGLRNEDLNIELDDELVLTCTATDITVTFTKDSKKYAEPYYSDNTDTELDAGEQLDLFASKNNSFVAIDFETANAGMSTICQVGIVIFSDGKVVDEWSTLINPEDYFDDVNISIHGIELPMVQNKPTFPEIASKLREHIEGKITVCHTFFDRTALARACEKYKIEPIKAQWLNSATVVRKTWSDLSKSGYGLGNVCKKIGYNFKHHDALEDARAAGHVMLAAIQESNLNIEEWQQRIRTPSFKSSGIAGIFKDGNPDGYLFGEVMVFTGALEILRRDAAEIAAKAGCQVNENVTTETTILVVGDQDIMRLAGHVKSNKHRKAEQLAMSGQPIRIICETDFLKLAGL
ncbi:exonuclease domain-containing protein [soil metagenome]